MSDDHQAAADAVYREIVERHGEGMPRPRLEPTRRVVELLGDPQSAYPVIHVTGTNGKTSTSRIIESILRAFGLRTGLLISPHLMRFNERIVIDGEAIGDEALAVNWNDITPYMHMVDSELEMAGEPHLTFFEATTVLAFAAFADAPVDVAVVEVGMGGEWDATNIVDCQVAVFTPIALDHVAQLGNTVGEIARTKSGIVKPLANVVSARQPADALAEIVRAATLSEATLEVQDRGFCLVDIVKTAGGQLVGVQGLAARYDNLFLPLFGDHQGQNAAVAIAAVESFLGAGSQELPRAIVAEGLAEVRSPGRLQIIGTEPTVLVDAAHNPHGAEALADALVSSFQSDTVVAVLGVLSDKDANGIVLALAPHVDEFVVTTAPSGRALPAAELAAVVAGVAGESRVLVCANPLDALRRARLRASELPRSAVIVTGSVALVGEMMGFARSDGWATA